MVFLKKNYKILLFVFVSLAISCNKNVEDENFGVDIANFGYKDAYKSFDENPFIATEVDPLSLFSTHVQGASYSDMRQFVKLGKVVEPKLVQIEDFLNYFTFDYPEPIGPESVSINSELSSCPWNTEHFLVRVGLKGKTILPSELPGVNYVFLVDVSKSMLSPERLSLIQIGLKLLVESLGSKDRLAIVSYSNNTKLVLSSTSCDRKTEIKNAIDNLSNSGTVIESPSLLYSYSLVLDNLIPNGNNRVVMVSDGDLNVNPSSKSELVKLIQSKKQAGIGLTVVGVGETNPNNHLMELIPNFGNGNYEYVDKVEQFLKVFVNEKHKFFTVANSTKISVTFNPQKVLSYRLIGYENRDFMISEIGELTTDSRIGSSQTITAIYELAMYNVSNDEPVGLVKVNYKKPHEINVRELQHEMKTSPVHIDNASENMRFAVSVTAFGLLLKQSQFKGVANKEMVLNLSGGANNYDPYNYRKEFVSLVNTWFK